jgi:hypothetical protein
MEIRSHLKHREDSGTERTAAPPWKHQRKTGTHWRHPHPSMSTIHQRNHEGEERERLYPGKPPCDRQKHRRQVTKYAHEEQVPVFQGERDNPKWIR